jgi:N-acetylglucosamine-6-sulfatase
MSLCAPSRACFLTGLYPHHNGIINNNLRWNQELQTMPRLLQAAGYRTAHIGKFHMDQDDRMHPGYDYWAAQIAQGQYDNPRKNVNGQWADLEGYDTNIVTDQAIEFMRDARRRNAPFMTWIGYKACHGPFTPAPGHERDFADLDIRPPASFYADDQGKPARVRNKTQNWEFRQRAAAARNKKKQKKQAGDPLDSLAGWAERERNQHRALMGVEDSVHRLLTFLEEQKILDNTLIVFAGDNGFFHGEHGLHGKMEAYEESLRIPVLARFPRAIRGGQRVGALTSNIDFAPTVLDFCGVKAGRPVDGQSWRPLVTGGPAAWRESFVYSMHNTDAARPTVKALRTERHKLILNLTPRDKDELYDLQADPEEMKNLAGDAAQKELVARLKRQLVEEMKKIGDPAVEAVQATR